jgi:hypothetical protein
MDYAFMNLSADTNVGFGGVIDAGFRHYLTTRYYKRPGTASTQRNTGTVTFQTRKFFLSDLSKEKRPT